MLWLLLLLVLPSALLAQDVPALHGEFADRLIAALHSNDSNECTSALGVSMAFSLVYPSMTGEALAQTQSIFGYPEGSNGELVWTGAQDLLNRVYDGTCLQQSYADAAECGMEEPTIIISNAIWVDSSQSVVDLTYASVVGGSLTQIDFSDETAGGLVNTWVSNATRGLIPELVSSGPLAPLVLLAVNAIYLKGSWAYPFYPRHTSIDTWYASASKTTPTTQEANFMHQVEFFDYSDQAIPGFQIVKFSFTLSDLSMVMVLPISDESGTVASSDIGPTISQLARTRLALGMPKFQLELTYSDTLKAALESLGVIAPFNGGLCIFENDCSSAIEYVIQKTFISVDEEGVEAAAVTGIAVGVSLPVDVPVEVLFDHPFQFFIWEEQTQLVLFEGRLGEPELLDTTVEFTARHTDDDFWSSNFYVEPTQVTGLALPTNETTPIDGNSTNSPTPTCSQAPSSSSAPTTSLAPSPADSTNTSSTIETDPTLSAGVIPIYSFFFHSLSVTCIVLFLQSLQW